VRKALDVGQSDFVLRQNVEYAFGFMLRPQAFRDLLRVLVWSSGENMPEVYL